MTLQEQIEKHPWLVCRNGDQIDIHVHVATPEMREITVAANVHSEDLANYIVEIHACMNGDGI